LFPWGTLFVNVTGSAVLGFFATLSGPDGRLLVGAETRVFVMAGFAGVHDVLDVQSGDAAIAAGPAVAARFD
jgi:hypothetical protein